MHAIPMREEGTSLDSEMLNRLEDDGVVWSFFGICPDFEDIAGHIWINEQGLKNIFEVGAPYLANPRGKRVE